MMENPSPRSRDTVLALLGGRRDARVPCFSGLISVTAAGLQDLGYHFSDVHADPVKMAAAAASTHRLYGFESAVAPLDLCVEASALGVRADFRAGSDRPEYPTPKEPLYASAAEFKPELPSGVLSRGRIPVVLESIRLLKEEVGREIVVGAWVPGPLTLAMQLIDLNALIGDVAGDPDAVGRVLDTLADLLAEVGSAYRSAGADFITVHEMGVSPGLIGPRSFERLVLPRLKRLIASLPAPRVLSACGNTNRSVALLAQCGAEAISVDQLNDLAKSRETLGAQTLLFGNIDPVGTLAEGDETAVREAVARAIEGGADAVWPGCDLWPVVPPANMRAMVEAARTGA